ncbi:MAG: hypothetical protein QOE01_1496 [Actinomycetota bacterium]|jgi:hypothetical protein|nr:hypothetical protein [Actinomycetota bacterium]
MTGVLTRDAPALRRTVHTAVPDAWGYLSAVVIGSILIVITGLHQPLNQNEIQQIRPYGSLDVHAIVSATRQPPLDPLVGTLVQAVLGKGLWQQRLLPILAGIGTLVFLALLLRRLRTEWGGAIGLLIVATSPLMVRFSPYDRPYATPLFLMILFCYAAQRWLDDRQRRWLALLAVVAVALPLTRVPEPSVLLATTGLGLTVLAWRKRRTWAEILPVVAISWLAMLFVAYPMYRQLKSSASGIAQTNLLDAITSSPSGMKKLVTVVVPILGEWFPLRPLTLLLLLTSLLIPAARRRLLSWWFFLPLALAPIAFAVLYYIEIRYSLLPYRPRHAYFFVPVLALVASAVATVAIGEAGSRTPRRVQVFTALLLGAVVLGQLPATAKVVFGKEAADFALASHVLTSEVPCNATVLYNNPTEPGQWQQSFLGSPRWMGKHPRVVSVHSTTPHVGRIPDRGQPIYILLLDSQCGSAVCDLPAKPWAVHIDGWTVERFDRFALYRPTDGQTGRRGALQAAMEFRRAMSPSLGYSWTFAAMGLIARQGDVGRAHQLLERLYRQVGADSAAEIARKNAQHPLSPWNKSG